MNPSPDTRSTRGDPETQGPVVIQVDPRCLHSALKEFFEPLRTNDPRTDFFAIYRRESGEFDRDYAKKYDEDLNTSLIFAGLFSAVSSAFIIDVQSKLEPDPNEMTAAYMRILIHTMNNSLFPDADPASAAWTGPPPDIVTVQSLLYASLTTSLFAAFLAMLGKQWVNRYLRNRGGSAADKSRDRQQKLDGFEKWHFHLAIESLPVMLQLALLLLGCALSRYLWMTSRTVAEVIITVTIFEVTSYVLLTLAVTFYYNCPYQTPPSVVARAFIRYVVDGNDTFARSLRSIMASLPSVGEPKRILGRLLAGVVRALEKLRCASGVPEWTEHIPLAVVTSPSPTRRFEDAPTTWDVYKADIRCISWVLSSTTDADVIYSTVRFAGDMIWYPEVVGALSPHILAQLLFDCLVDGQVVPGKSGHASSIGMALAAVLSTQLTIEPRNPELKELCKRIEDDVQWAPSSAPALAPVVAVLKFIAEITTSNGQHSKYMSREFANSIPNHLPTTEKLWLSRVTLHTLWRWRCAKGPTGALEFPAIASICWTLTADDDKILAILKTTLFLTMAVSLGLQIDIHDLYAPNNNDALQAATDLFCKQVQIYIREGMAERVVLRSILYALNHLDPFQVTNNEEYGFLWVTDILNSGCPDFDCHEMASMVIRLLGKRFRPGNPGSLSPSWVLPLLDFLSLCENLHSLEGFHALRILSFSPGYSDLGARILPVLVWILPATHPLRSRGLAPRTPHRPAPGWFPPQMENVLYKDLGKLLQAVGDPLQFPDPLYQDGQGAITTDYEPMMTVVILIEFASSELWWNHLRRSNFTSCEASLFTEEGRRTVLRCMLYTATHSRPEFLDTSTKIVTAIKRLEELQCLNTAEAVILWAWTVGVVNVADHDTWGPIERITLNFYRTHGKMRLTALSRHITDASMETEHMMYLLIHYRDPPCRVGSVRQLAPFQEMMECFEGPNVAQVCQLRRSYHLFGYDTVSWKEAVAVEEVNERTDTLSVQLVTPTQFADWTCDYP